MTIATAIIIGVVSGLLTTFVVVVLRLMWLRIAEPWYENKVYKDAAIEGRWKAHVAFDDGSWNELWELYRTGHNVSGVVTTLNGPDEGMTFEIEGTFRNLILTGSYSAKNQAVIDRGTFTFTLVENGRKLIGHSAFYFDQQHAVETCKYNIERE